MWYYLIYSTWVDCWVGCVCGEEGGEGDIHPVIPQVTIGARILYSRFLLEEVHRKVCMFMCLTPSSSPTTPVIIATIFDSYFNTNPCTDIHSQRGPDHHTHFHFHDRTICYILTISLGLQFIGSSTELSVTPHRS